VSNTGSSSTSQEREGDQLSLEQKGPLLRSKLFVQPVRSDQITRHRLIELLNGGLDKTLILVSAPAGYGKTTLLSNWLHETEISSAWLSLDKRDNDPVRFLHYFLSALQQIVPTIRLDLLEMLQGIQPPPYEALMSLVINDMDKNPAPGMLVLDDFHVIEAQPILEMLTFLLEHMPPQMHLALLSRTDPPLPLSRLRVRNQLLNIRADQLRFTLDEIALFLNDLMGLELTASDMAAMERRTEGWIAGLQLAALSMQGCKDLHGFVSAFTGSHYYIMDYLAEEVLKLQPQEVSTFLLQTSILERMCAPLCTVVVEDGTTGPVDSQARLESLEQMNLFLIPLDGERRWYRYHHLFSDVLNRRLEHQYPDQLPELHQRASKWYELNNFLPEAIQHALEAGDLDRAVRLVEEKGCFLLMTGEVHTLLGWIEAIGAHGKDSPWLAIQKAWALTLAGSLDQVDHALQEAERLVSLSEQTPEHKTMLGTIAADRAFLASYQADMRLAVEFAHQALEYLPDNEPLPQSMRSVANIILAEARWMDGNLQEAGRIYTETIRNSQAAGDIPMLITNNTNLADILVEQGQLHRAARIYSETIELALRPDERSLPSVAQAYVKLSSIYYEWNQLDVAARYARHCIEICQLWGNAGLQAEACLMLSRVERAQGNLERAQNALRLAEELIGECRLSTRQTTWLKSTLARMWLVQGNPERPADFLLKSGLPVECIEDDIEIPYLRETEYLLLARLFLFRDQTDHALAISRQLLQKPEAGGRMGMVIDVLVLRALAFEAKKDHSQALATLERALSLAQPEGYRRVFLDEGKPMAKLLALSKSQRIEAGYAAELLSQMQIHPGKKQPIPQALIEPLSLRELEVLKLIEAGNSNQEIAGSLFISIPTVKRHISNIYAKLGVKSRTQALALSKELDLLDRST